MTTAPPSSESPTDESTRGGGTQHLSLTMASLALVLTCTLIWGGQAIAAKVSVDTIPAVIVLALRFLLALPILFLAAYLGRWPLRIHAGQARLVAGNSLLVFLQTGLFLVGTGLTSSARSIVIINTFPFFAALAGRLLTNDSALRPRQWLGMILSVVGLQIVLLPRLSHGTQASLVGDVLVLLAAALMGFKIAYVRRILSDLNAMQSVFWSTLLGAIACSVAVVCFYDVRSIEFSGSAIAAILYQGFLVSGIAVLIWTYLLSRHPINHLTVFRLASPPIGIFLSWILMSESLTVTLIAGTALITYGIYQVTSTAAQVKESH